MLVKCKTKGTRVKGLAFHPSLNFLLASLHNGEIELWDYVNNMIVEVFRQHDGPVRALDFHLVQPLFVSGGDDTTYPWIVSSSDDNTVRIWNWQSRDCVTVLSGHNHYVMCAQFCMHSDLIVSASLDHTARVWDFKTLREKKCSMGDLSSISDAGAAGLFSSVQLFGDRDLRQDSGSSGFDAMAFTDAYCKFTLNGHTKGVNWAIFHEKAPIIVTAGDDNTVRAWRYTSTNAWQTNIMRDHTNNVCSLIMHPNNINYLLSVSEDHTIRVWDTNKWRLSGSFTMDQDRVWIIAKAQNSNYIAAGHDSGLVVFKLFKERPIVTIHKNHLYYVWDKVVYVGDIEKECDDVANDVSNNQKVEKEQKSANCSVHELLNQRSSRGFESELDEFNSLRIDLSEGMLNITFRETVSDHGSWPNLSFPPPCGDYINKRTVLGHLNGIAEFGILPGGIKIGKQTDSGSVTPSSIAVNHYNSDQLVLLVTYQCNTHYYFEILTRIAGGLQSHVRKGISACFATKNLLVAIDSKYKAAVYNILGEFVTMLDLQEDIEAVFPISLNVILLWPRGGKRIFLYDVVKQCEIAQAPCSFKKLSNVILSKSKRMLATVHSNDIVIYDRNMQKITSVSHNTKIKSAAWFDNVAFLYASTNHIYYLLINGDYGLLKSISRPMYFLGSFPGNYMCIMERDHKCKMIKIESHEFTFKCALYHRHLSMATKMIDSGLVHGRTIVSYLVEKGHADMARKIVKDPKMRFDLAIGLGDLVGALQDAQTIDDVGTWLTFGDSALAQGNVVYAELGFQKAKEFSKLSLLYLVTGNTTKLKKMQNISKFCNNVTGTIQHCMYLGDMETLAETLKENGCPELAKVCENTYSADAPEVQQGAKYLVPPQPILRLSGQELNWPLEPPEPVAESLFFEQSDEPASEVEEGPDFNMDQDLQIPEQQNEIPIDASKIDSGVWDMIADNELVLENVLGDASEAASPVRGVQKTLEDQILSYNATPLNLAAAGKVDKAIEKLESLYGFCNPMAVKDLMCHLYQSSRAHASIAPNLNPLVIPIYKNLSSSSDGSNAILNTYLSLESVVHEMKHGFTNVTQGNFTDAIVNFKNALVQLLFLLPLHPKQAGEHIQQCSVYVLAMLLEAERERLSTTDIQRSLELAAYFGCCNLQNQHRYLVLRRTMGIMWKAQNYVTTAILVTKLLRQNVSNIQGAQDEITKAKRIYTLCEQKKTEMYNLDFDADDLEKLEICTVSYTKLNGRPTASCRFCKSVALVQYKNSKCNVCTLCKLT
ncbi:bifunctional Coatomer [Babesia duncani]|uniref:Bifunctional Coatomer n=1 Tax=Babesia duncani TaxID=323732 RepID=A0AAD9PIG4_9APIC|nr:bifunctional Coatomer [Babesia duncani]